MTAIPIIPAIRYKDAQAAITFLINAFGFKEHLVVPDDSGGIAHAQLLHPNGEGMVMLGSARDDEWSQYVQPPGKGQINTMGIYMVVTDVDQHCEAARAAGAEIVDGPEDRDYGGRGYSCRDCEGVVWSFGDYDPLT